ncbi:P-loop containing nucleoside triphosphate hydrolase protein [Daldinia grandis]|nr:P-loop containing nucleoside triphosphate hydrolase protein [Daldinia grandis]
MDYPSLEYNLAKIQERVKTLEKIVLISAETQAEIWKHVPNKLDKSREIIIELLEGSQNITTPSQTKSLMYHMVDEPQSPGESSHDAQSSNNSIHSIENPDQARYEAEIEEMKTELLEKTRDYDRARMLLQEERKKTQTLVGTLRDIQGNIRVLCRIRPPGKDTPEEELVDFGPQERGEFSSHWGKITISTTRKDYKGDILPDRPKIYDFERIFGSSDTNEHVFDHISDLVESSMQGQRVVMFAYGQTGAGKTFTLSHRGSDAKQNGVIPRSLDLLFQTQKDQAEEFEYLISVSIQEIYQNKTFDLLEAVEANGKGDGVRLNSVRKQPLHSHEEALSVIEAAMDYRVVSKTDMNATSSRSHMIISFEIIRKSRGNANEVKGGVLNIVDLAGSERPNSMGLKDEIRNEGIKINKSLMSLTKLINCIATGQPVTYDTELVRALKPALSAETKVVMFVMISPLKKDQEVSFQTLERGREASAAKMASVEPSGSRPTPLGPSTRPTGSGTSSSRGSSPSRGRLSTRGSQGRGRP